jgi:hypothetical protein
LGKSSKTIARAHGRLSRVVIVVSCGMALLIASLGGGIVFWLVLLAWAGMGAALGPAIVLSFYWRRTTRAGLIAGIVAGTATVITWSLVPSWKAALYEWIPAWIVGATTIVVVSLCTRPAADAGERIAEFEWRHAGRFASRCHPRSGPGGRHDEGRAVAHLDVATGAVGQRKVAERQRLLVHPMSRETDRRARIGDTRPRTRICGITCSRARKLPHAP